MKLIWQEGVALPNGSLSGVQEAARNTMRLPERFAFSTECCSALWFGRGRCVDGVWNETVFEAISKGDDGVVYFRAAGEDGERVLARRLAIEEEAQERARAAAERSLSLHMSKPLRDEVEALMAQGLDVRAAVARLAETRPGLFAIPIDDAARWLAMPGRADRVESLP